MSSGTETNDELVKEVKEKLREFYMENLDLEVQDSQIVSIKEYFMNMSEGEELLKKD